ncbi:hypothetical protein FOZ60_002589 [Perkinsus olseni]|uniref:Repressor of RNA polymerase III transcription MAF1 n=1 Tax=Perkinsus olseni TaxID=32597 RepID=A0A7J6NYD9_PEROL|nr:hypothetical protein FOZ60_002589 [Perkinsus olseni]
MQWIDNQKLRQISARINTLDLADLRLDCRLELFATISSSSANQDINNRIPLPIEKSLNNELRSSPHLLKASPLGPLSAQHSRQLLVTLIGALNDTFPDYQFNTLSPDHFVKKEDPAEVVSNNTTTPIISVIATPMSSSGEVNQYFGTSLDLAQPGLVAELWGAVQSCVSFIDTEVYELVDDLSLLTAADDDSGSHLWQFHYFFNDNKHKRLLLFAVKATSRYVHGHTTGSEADDEDDDMMQPGEGLYSSPTSARGYYSSSDSERSGMGGEGSAVGPSTGNAGHHHRIIKRSRQNGRLASYDQRSDDQQSSIWSQTSRRI